MRRLSSSSLLLSSLLSVSAASGVLAISTSASAQVSDADKEAARNLFHEGDALQTAGRYAEALDRFKRSEQVYPAPTALLHIAQCEARLGRLVEAAETYRLIARTPLPANAPPPFVAAQAQGAAELQQVEPRIPHIRLEVTPTNIPNLAVWIDEQPLNTALLGVDRPIDPGDHKFTAQAPGFDRTEIVVPVQEKQPTRLISLPLKVALAGGAPYVAPYAAPYGQPGQPPVYVQPAAPVYPQGVPPAGYGVAPPTAATPPADPSEPSRKGIFFGARVGGLYPALSSMAADIDGGALIGAEFDFRFARRLYVGAVVDHGFLSSSSGAGTYSTTNVDVTFGVLTNPDKFGGIFQAAVGYRSLSISVANPVEAGSLSTSVSSPEVGLSAGMWIPIGQHFRLVPRVDTTFGSFSDGLGGYGMVSFVLAAYPNFNFH